MRNKLSFVYLVFLFLSLKPICGQTRYFPKMIDNYEVLDSSKLVVSYSLEIVNDTVNPNHNTKDKIILQVGNKMSKSHSEALYSCDSIGTSMRRKGARNVPLCSVNTIPEEIFKTYGSQSCEVACRAPFDGSVFLYDDSCNINWELSNKTKEIQGYLCRLAIAKFRGRVWEAWFTFEIPVMDGPWKFCNLPGLILEVSDSNKHYTFSCIGIEEKVVPIVKWDWIYEKTNRQKVRNYFVSFHNNPYSMLNNKLKIVGKTEAETKKTSFPYNPIELE
ncbi:MAG: GLPGLI family protein [Bacteroidales bacterium]|jgi:GLPGLI family protein